MKIGIIGSGNVGSALGQRWAAAGHEIKYGARNTAKPELVALLKKIGARASAGSVAEAAAFGEVLVLTTPWNGTQAAIESAGDVAGKIIVDCTNPLKSDLSGLSIGLDTSGAEQVAQWAKGARVVKCFNTTGAENMTNPRFGSDRAVMFLAADDDAAKAIVSRLGEDLGFEMVDAGRLEIARLLEPVAMLWVHLAFRRGLGRNFAFKLLRR
jgi:8-hydroxy-5-deazaflavin:NADPH oxidoreductase